jgi:hypothetical protein
LFAIAVSPSVATSDRGSSDASAYLKANASFQIGSLARKILQGSIRVEHRVFSAVVVMDAQGCGSAARSQHLMYENGAGTVSGARRRLNDTA